MQSASYWRQIRGPSLTHLTAVSGANLTLLLGFLLTTARWIRVRGWWLRVVGLAGMIIFVARVA
jgi:competence protein ComEC